MIKKVPSREPGAWRIEVSPEHNRRDESFLVVMLAQSNSVDPQTALKELRSENNLVGVEINAPSRVLRLWFNRDNSNMLAEVIDNGSKSTYEITR